MSRLEEKLKVKSLRVTKARKVIFDILRSADKPLSPKNICDKIGESIQSQADQASVYRNLSLFSEIGLIHRLDSGKYTACNHGSESGHNHFHLITHCLICGETQELNQNSKQAEDFISKCMSLFEGFDLCSSLTMSGRCNSCSGKSHS